MKYIAAHLTSSGFDVLTYSGDNTREYEVIYKFQSDGQILVATDIAAEGFNLEFCSLVINYDMLYNVLEIEQRINRCHRQGQENDVIVLSFLEKSNYGDIRTLEIANKRLTQYQGIIGMSDQVMGNFGADVAEVIRANARHKHDIQREFEQTLNKNRAENEVLVDAAETGAPLAELSRYELLKAEREVTLLLKRMKDAEKSLHHDKMKLEQELRAEVEAFLGKSKLTVKLSRQFVLSIKGGSGNG